MFGSDHVETMRLLIEHGARPSEDDATTAIKRGNLRCLMALVNDYGVKFAASPSLVCTEHIAVARWLVRRGSHAIDARGELGNAFSYAVEEEALGMIKWLYARPARRQGRRSLSRGERPSARVGATPIVAIVPYGGEAEQRRTHVRLSTASYNRRTDRRITPQLTPCIRAYIGWSRPHLGHHRFPPPPPPRRRGASHAARRPLPLEHLVACRIRRNSDHRTCLPAVR